MFGTLKSGSRRILVVYYSVTGNTARVAGDLAKVLGADVERIRDKGYRPGFMAFLKAAVNTIRGIPAKIEEPIRDPGKYSLVIIGTPVWAWHMTPAVCAYLEKCKASFNDVALFVTSGDTDVAKILPAFERACGHPARASAGFNAKGLADQVAYDDRLMAFGNTLDRLPVPAVGVDEAALAR